MHAAGFLSYPSDFYPIEMAEIFKDTLCVMGYEYTAVAAPNDMKMNKIHGQTTLLCDSWLFVYIFIGNIGIHSILNPTNNNLVK